MIRSRVLLLPAVLVLHAACTTTATSREDVARLVSASGFTAGQASGFVPIEPIPAKSTVEVKRNGALVSTDIRLLTPEESLNFLADTWSKIAVSKVNTDGSLSYLTGSITAEKGHYAAIMDYTKYFIEDIVEGQKKLGRYRTGIGLRLVADIQTRKAGIDIGGLLKIGLAASRNELSGSLEVRCIGVTSKEIDSLLPGILPTVDESAIQAALESMAAVKAKFRDAGTVISPRHFAVELYASTAAGEIKAPQIR